MSSSSFLSLNAPISLKVWCEDPETNKEAKTFVTKTYLTYRVLLKQDGRDLIGVRHRYSEFETLRSSIASKFIPLGITTPVLPPKKPMTSAISGNNTEKIFIKERTRGLSLFVESLCDNVFLRHDISWKAFMRPSSTTFQVLDDGDENIAEKELIKALNDANLDVKKAASNFIKVKEEIYFIEKHVKSVLSKLRNIQDYERKLANACEEYVSSLFTWGEKEKTDVKFLRGCGDDISASDIRGPEHVSSTISQLSLVATSQAITTKSAPDYSGVLLAVCLEHELSRVESFKELFKFYDELVFNIEAARKSEKFVTLAFDEQRLHRFLKGVFYVSIPLATRQRCEMFRNASSMVVSTMTTSSSRLFTDTINFFNNICMDPSKAVDEGALMMNLLSMPLSERGNVPIMSMDDGKELSHAPLPFYGILHTPAAGPYENTSSSKNNSSSNESSDDIVRQYEEVLSTATLNTASSTPVPYAKPTNPLARRTSVVINRRTSTTDETLPQPPPTTANSVTLDDGTSLRSLDSSLMPTSPTEGTADSPTRSATQTTRRQSAALADLLDMNTDSNKKSPFDD